MKKNANEKEIVSLMHNVVTAAFCYNPNDESLKEQKNVYTRPTNQST